MRTPKPIFLENPADLEQLKAKLRKVETECETLVKGGQMGMAQLKAEEREEVLADIELTEKMKKLGYDVEEAEKNNKEALTILTKDLLKLSSSSPKIKINDSEYSIKANEKQKFIEVSNKLMLSE